jgi:hypothetical protein
VPVRRRGKELIKTYAKTKKKFAKKTADKPTVAAALTQARRLSVAANGIVMRAD